MIWLRFVSSVSTANQSKSLPVTYVWKYGLFS